MKNQTKNTEEQPKSVESQANNVKTVSITKTHEKTELEKVLAELAELKKQIAEGPKSLDEKIKFYQEKQANINKLGKLDAFSESLKKIAEEATEATETDEFFSERFAVRVGKKTSSYREEFDDVLKIQNPVLVVEVLGFALDRINEKRQQLKTLIEA